MANQITFLSKNKADPDFSQSSVLASEGNDAAVFAVNRKNFSAWVTEASLDSNNTTFQLLFGRNVLINFIILIEHNFKSFKIEYFDGVDFVDFAQLVGGAAIDETVNTAKTNFFQTVDVTTEKIRLTIRGTTIVNDPKIMSQFIATELIGKFEGFPAMERPKVGRSVQTIPMLDGLNASIEHQGAYSTRLKVSQYTIQADLDIIETLLERSEGFLFWPSGGSETQFTPLVRGYRLKDIFLCRFKGQFAPQLVQGIYSAGIEYSAELLEVNR